MAFSNFFVIALAQVFHGSLASSRVDFALHLRCDICRFPRALPTGVRLGATVVDFLIVGF